MIELNGIMYTVEEADIDSGAFCFQCDYFEDSTFEHGKCTEEEKCSVQPLGILGILKRV